MVASSAGRSNFWIEASDSPSFSRSDARRLAEGLEDLLPAARLALFPGQRVAGAAVDGLEVEDVVRAETADAAPQHGLGPFPLADLPGQSVS